MATIRRLSTIAVLIVCFIATPWSGTLFAQSQESSPTHDASAQPLITPDGTPDSSATPLSASMKEQFRAALNDAARRPAGTPAQVRPRIVLSAPAQPTLTQRGFYGGRGRGRNHGALAAIALGAVATIAGGAILVYANRPDCSTNQTASGCGYGTKVAGGAVLSAGVVGLVVGAAIWR